MFLSELLRFNKQQSKFIRNGENRSVSSALGQLSRVGNVMYDKRGHKGEGVKKQEYFREINLNLDICS